MADRLSRNSHRTRRSAVALAPAIFFVVGPMPTVRAEADAPRALGVESCVDCHELPAEAWQHSAHALQSLETLRTNPLAQRYRQRLGISHAPLHSSVCTDCHGTRQQAADGHPHVVNGVSCESCHGAAGSSPTTVGWIALHNGDAEPQLSDRQRTAACRDAGMAGVEDVYELATRCYTCHNVSNERVVQTGHPAGAFDFEWTAWFYGEVRHNFAPYTMDVVDCDYNNGASNVWLAKDSNRDVSARRRLMYVAGQLVDLEVSLRNRGKATAGGSFATAAAGRVAAAHARVNAIAQTVSCYQLNDALEAVDVVRPLLFLPPDARHQMVFLNAAAQVGQAAKAFVTEHDGTRLKAIDPLMPRETKGEAFQP